MILAVYQAESSFEDCGCLRLRIACPVEMNCLECSENINNSADRLRTPGNSRLNLERQREQLSNWQ